MTSESKQPSDLILRLKGIAYRDEAKAVTVRAEDLRAVLGLLSKETATAPNFDKAWAETGYNYGEDALSNVRVGWDLAVAQLRAIAPRLDAPARIGATTFGKGVMWSTVIRRAQDEHRWGRERPTLVLTNDEHHWLDYAVNHMEDDSEPEDKTCARVLRGLLARCVTPFDPVKFRANKPQYDEAPKQPGDVDVEMVPASLYASACDSVEEWKNRAMDLEETLERLHAQANAENGPTAFGEPVLSKDVPADRLLRCLEELVGNEYEGDTVVKFSFDDATRTYHIHAGDRLHWWGGGVRSALVAALEDQNDPMSARPPAAKNPAKPTAWCPDCLAMRPHHGDPDSIHLHLCDTCGGVVDDSITLPPTSPKQATRMALNDLKQIATEVTVENAPLGTKAPATIGGHWCRVPGGWKWNGPGSNGGTFPRPGGDWNGQLILPEFRA